MPGFDAQRIMNMVGGLFTPQGLPATFLSQVQLWAIKFMENAPARFGVQMFGQNACARGRCREPAIAACNACREPICMAHGWFSHEANALCEKCARAAVRNISQGRSWGRQDAEQQHAPPPPPPGPQRVEAHVVAFMVLGLETSATLEDVNRRYKALVAHMHPDRTQKLSDTNRAELEQSFKKYTQARDVLVQYFSRRRAA